jgi:hypothetical protein
MRVYEVATESILQCFIMDKKYNEEGDSLDNCPPELRVFMGPETPKVDEQQSLIPKDG